MQNIDELCQLSLESFNNLTYEELDSAYDFIAALTAEPNFKKTYKLSDRKKYILFANKAVARMDELEEEAKNEVSVDMPEDLEEDLEVLDITVCHEDVDQELETSVCPQPEEQKINNAEINMECLSDDEVQINEDKLNKLKTWAQNESVSYTDIDDLVNKYCQADIKAIFNETQKGSESDDADAYAEAYADAYVNAVEDKIFGYTREERVCLRAFSYDKIKAEVGIMAMRIETETEFKTFRVDRDNMLRVYRLSDDELRIAEAELRYDDQDAHNIMLRGAQEFIKNGKSIIPCQLWEDPAKPGKKSTKERLPFDYLTKVSLNPTFKEEDNAYLIQTNKRNQIMVLDLDQEKKDSTGNVTSKSGMSWLKAICKKEGQSINTYTVKSGSGGYHYYFLYDENVSYRIGQMVGKTMYGVDMIINGAIFGPGSFHPISGSPYKVENNPPVKPCPQWLLPYLKADRLDSKLNPCFDDKAFDDNEVSDDFCNSKHIAKTLLDIIPHRHFESYGPWRALSIALKNSSFEFSEYHDFCKSTPNYTGEADCQNIWDLIQTHKESIKYNVKWIMGFAKRCEESKERYEVMVKKGTIRLIPKPSNIPYFMHPDYKDQKTRKTIMKDPALAITFRRTIMSKFYRLISSNEIEVGYFIQNGTTFSFDVVSNESFKKRFDGMTVAYKDDSGAVKWAPFYCEDEMTEIYKYVDMAEKPLVFWSDDDDCLVYNKWIRPAMTKDEMLAHLTDPVLEQTTLEKLKYHVKSVFCGLTGEALKRDDNPDFLYFMKWVAHTLVHPGKMLDTALVLLGDEGVGKTTLIEKIYKAVMGRAFTTFTGTTFVGNGALKTVIGKSMVLIDDIPEYGMKRKDIDKLKTLITNDVLTGKMLYKDEAEYINHMNAIFTGNGFDPLSLLDGKIHRRFVVYRCSDAGIPGEHDKGFTRVQYFEPLYDIPAVTLAAVIVKHFYDPLFNAKGFQSTATKNDMSNSIHEVHEFVQEEIIQKYYDIMYIRKGHGALKPENNVSCEALYKSYVLWFTQKYPERVKEKGAMMSDAMLRTYLQRQCWLEAGSQIKRRKMGPKCGDKTGYGQTNGYVFPSLEEMIKNFERRTGKSADVDVCSGCKMIGANNSCIKTDQDFCDSCAKKHKCDCPLALQFLV